MATTNEIKQIKLLNNETYDIVDAGAVRFDKAQSLTDEQKSQTITNIGIEPIPDSVIEGLFV